MNAKLSNFSELSNILSVKSSLRTNLMALFGAPDKPCGASRLPTYV